MGELGVATLVVVALCAASAISVPLGGAAGLAPGRAHFTATSSITVTATGDYGYTPDTLEQVPVGTTVAITFVDASVLQHSFTISSREGFVIPTTDSPQQLTQLFTSYPAIFSIFVNGTGDQHTASFSSPSTPGWYEFVCNVSGHFQNGMYGFIAFGENLPSNLTAPSRTGLGGGTITPIEGASIAGVVAVVALAAIVVHRRRSKARIRPPPR